VVPAAELAGNLGERGLILAKAALASGEGLLLTPRRTDTDGFFVSLMRRTA
jgi:16S rRNA (cytosine967-C5)-methyltransferase